MAGLREGRAIAGVRAFDDAVRIPVAVDELRLRISDRIASRLPVITRTLAPRLIAAPAGSRLRVAVLTRMLIAGFAALDRRDWDYLQRIYAPDVLYRSVPDFFLDVPDQAIGWPTLQAGLASFMEAFGDADQRPVEFVDLGGPFFAARVASSVEGRYSGIAMEREFVYLYELGSAGVVVRQWAAYTLADVEAFYEQRLAELGQASARRR